MKQWIALAIVATVLPVSSCRKSSTIIETTPPPSAAGVYVVNEGGFSGGASLSYYDKQRDSMFNAVIGASANWTFPNDMIILGGKGYVAVNGSDRVDVLNLSAPSVAKSIQFPQFSGPGYLAADGSTLFVANYDGSVSIVAAGIDTLRTTTPAAVKFPGGIAFTNGKVFVSDYGTYVNNQFVAGHYVKIFSPALAQVTDSVRVGDAPGAMTVMSGKLFVVCVGSATAQPRLYQIDPNVDRADDSLQIPGSVSDLANDGRYLYVLSSNGVGRFALQPLRTLQNPYITRTNGNYFYSLAVDASSGDIYVTNVVSSGGSGELEIYALMGTLKRRPMPVGIFPGALCFRR
ncbi:MAG TPA: hypothetical protein VES59_10685 [Bacteroidota bacterium]|nr:hypothetical protein [Bacteroidota bacterium]